MLSEGKNDIIIGDRFAGGIEKGAMPLSHRIGVRFLSRIGRMRTGTDMQDFHCGLRGMTKEAAGRLELRAEGMEFATEMIAAAAREGLRIGQCPVSLRKCRLDWKSKLRTLPDGIRHLKYLLEKHSKRKEQKNGKEDPAGKKKKVCGIPDGAGDGHPGTGIGGGRENHHRRWSNNCLDFRFD